MNAMAKLAAKERQRQKEALHDGQPPRAPRFAKSLSREHDEAVLDWLTRTDAGETCQSIATDYGIGRGAVSRACAAVRAAI